jgi:hypothetical protein
MKRLRRRFREIHRRLPEFWGDALANALAVKHVKRLGIPLGNPHTPAERA